MATKTWTSGEVLTATDLNTYAANPGLVWVAAATLTVTTTPTNITGVFDATKYKNYRVLFNVTARSTTNRVDMRYIAGTTPTSSSYYQAGIGADWATTATLYYQRSNNDNQFFGLTTTQQTALILDIFNPNKATDTIHTGQTINRNDGFGYSVNGVQLSNTVFTGLQLFSNTGTVTLEYQVFGYRD